MPEITDRLRRKAAENRVPITAALELSPLCNFKCKMCYVRKTPEEVRDGGGLLPGSWWVDIVEQARDAGLLYPLITGGEPFLYPDFPMVYERLSEMGMLLSVNTNGSLITDKTAAWLEKHPPVRLNITLYGASDQAYEQLTGDPRGFTRVLEALRILENHGLRFIFNASITPQNQNEMKDLIAFGKAKKTPVRFATYMFPPLRRSDNSFGTNERLSPEDSGRCKATLDYYQMPTEAFVKVARHYSRFKPLDQIDFSTLPETEGRTMRCYAGRSSYWVDWQGGLSACGMITSPRISLKDHRLVEAWTSIVQSTDKMRFGKCCTSCPNFRICNSCAALVYSECGDLNGRPDYQCRTMEAAAIQYRQFLEKLILEGKASASQPDYPPPEDIGTRDEDCIL